jgi:hypothetical protein
MKPNLKLVDPPLSLEERLLSSMEERERLKRELAIVEAAISADVKAWSYANGFRVPLRPGQVKMAIEGTDNVR